MLEKEILTAFYADQYRQNYSKNHAKNLRMPDAEHRANRLSKTLHNAQSSRMGITAMDEMHRQVRNLADYAQFKHRDKILRMVYDDLIPQLVRLDLGSLMPAQREGVD